MSVDLLPHNENAYEEVKKAFETQNRTAVIHPTGTGKSFIALKLIEENPNKKIIYIYPSLPIIQQLEKNMDKYGINSENIEIITYQRLNRMTREEIEALNADYIILDEFHHCGAPEWGKVVYELLETNKNAKTLGLSATPLRYTLSGIRDMVEEIFEGSIASEMSLESAIAEGILNEPTYVTGVYEYETLIGDLERRIQEYRVFGKTEKIQMAEQELRELKKNLEQAVTSLPDLLESSMPNKSGKYIVFCSSIEDMRKKIEAAPELFKKVNSNIDIMQVSSSDEDLRQNEETIERFSSDNNHEALKLLFCINMLNEGFHLEDIDGGIMMRATNSPTLYTQQLGRVVAAGKKQDTVLIDLVNNIDTIQNIIDFHYNLSKEKEKIGKTVKPFRVDKELRDIREIVLRIEKLTSRRSNVIDLKFESKLGISYEEAKELIDTNKELLLEARKTQYDNNGMVNDYELLNMFSKLRQAIFIAQHTRDENSAEYKMNLKKIESIREEIIVKNMGLAKWIVDNIPGLKELNVEDKEQMAIPYLIQAVDTYNPRLKTSEGTSLRFDEYALVFIKAGIESEINENRIIKIYDKLMDELGRKPTIQELYTEVNWDVDLTEVVYKLFHGEESFNAINEFDINTYQLADSDKIQYTQDGYIQDGVYLDEDTPYMRDMRGVAPVFEEPAWGEDNDIKKSLKRTMENLPEKNVDILYQTLGQGVTQKILADKYGWSTTNIYARNKKTMRVLRHPSRKKYISSYEYRNEDISTYEDLTNNKRRDTAQYNEDLETHMNIQSGELWNIRLSDVIEDEEIFQSLNEIGMWNLQELIESSEHQLRKEYGFDDEMIISITNTLGRLGLSMQGKTEHEMEVDVEKKERMEEIQKVLDGLKGLDLTIEELDKLSAQLRKLQEQKGNCSINRGEE